METARFNVTETTGSRLKANMPLAFSSVMNEEYAPSPAGAIMMSEALTTSSQKYLEARDKELDAVLNPNSVSPQVMTKLSNDRRSASMVFQYEAAKAFSEIENEDDLALLAEELLDKVAFGTQDEEKKRTSRERVFTGSKDIDNLLAMFYMAEEALEIVMEAYKKITEYYNTLVELKRLLETSVKKPDDGEGDSGDTILDFDQPVYEFMGFDFGGMPLGEVIQVVEGWYKDDDMGHLFTANTESDAQALVEKLGGGTVVQNEDGTYSVRIDMLGMNQLKDSYDKAKQQQIDGEGRLTSAQYSALTTALSAAQNSADNMIGKASNGSSFEKSNNEALIKLVISIIQSNFEAVKATHAF